MTITFEWELHQRLTEEERQKLIAELVWVMEMTTDGELRAQQYSAPLTYFMPSGYQAAQMFDADGREGGNVLGYAIAEDTGSDERWFEAKDE
jgi:hypothetical protein